MVTRSTKYLNIARAIRQKIICRLEPHQKLPSEPQLASRFGAARATIRRALMELRQEGLIESRQGAGTWVVEPRVEQDLERLFSFSEFMLQRGVRPGTQLLTAEMRTLGSQDSDILRHLRIRAGTRVIYIRRLRLGGKEPLVIANTWLPAVIFPDLLRPNLLQYFQHHSIYELMERTGLKPARAVQSIEAVKLDPEDARLLATAPDTPALLIQRVGYAQELPVEFARDYYRGDRTRFHVRLGTASLEEQH